MSGPWITRDLGDYSHGAAEPVPGGHARGGRAKATEELAKAGVDVIKAYVELGPAHYKAIADAAHRHKLKVHAHVYDPKTCATRSRPASTSSQHVGSAGMPPYDPELVRGDRGQRDAGRGHGRPPGFLFPATVDVSGAAPGPAAQGRLRTHDLERGPEFVQELPPRCRTSRRPTRRCSTRRPSLQQWIDSGVDHGHGNRLRHADELPHRGALARDQGARGHGHVAAARDHGGHAGQRPDSRARKRRSARSSPASSPTSSSSRANPLFDITALANVEVVVKDGVVWKGGKPR